MFENQYLINQQEVETQYSQPYLESYPSSQNLLHQIDGLDNNIAILDEFQLNELDSLSEINLQEISESSDQEIQKQYSEDVVFTTHHPSVLFGKKKYKIYKRLFASVSNSQNSIEELSSDQFGDGVDIKNYIISNLTQIESNLKTHLKKQKQPERDNLNQQQIIQFEEKNNIQSNYSLSDIDCRELDGEQNHNVEQKIQNYNSNCNILEKFSSQYKSLSQIDNF